ncbi:MAG: aminotransferase class I/II-fold pyridoxal phosphate-dependent enzyme, partial [Clostridia bacterium]
LKNTPIMILSDEIYAEMTYGGKKHISIAQINNMKERTIIVSGFSKAFAMTGWRLGYALAPKPILEQMLKIHQFAIMCSPTTSQYGAVKALENYNEYISPMVEEFDLRRKLITDGFNKIGLTCFNPQGAFYVFPSIEKTGLKSDEFCERLLLEKQVAIVPGTAFGDCGEGFVRVSYACSTQNILKALERITAFMEQFK